MIQTTDARDVQARQDQYDIIILGWIAHLTRHALLNTRVNYAAGSSLTGSITHNCYPKLRVQMLCISYQNACP